jgi:hypothetical protein
LPKRCGTAGTAPVEDSRMPLTEHLRELRNRLAKALLAFAVATVVCFIFYESIFDWLKEPYCSLPAETRLGAHGGPGASGGPGMSTVLLRHPRRLHDPLKVFDDCRRGDVGADMALPIVVVHHPGPCTGTSGAGR